MKQESNGWTLKERDPQFIASFMPFWELLYRYYFRVKTSGWHHIPPSGQVFIVGSHNGGLAAPDMSMMMYDWFNRFGFDRQVYGLVHPCVWKVAPEVAKLAMKTGAIRAHPRMAIAALEAGASVLVYPGGAQDVFRPHQQRDKIYFAGRKAFIKLALIHEVPIIPAISHGAHDTLIVLDDYYPIAKKIHEEWGCDLLKLGASRN